jgi:hypothetical protein
VIEVAAVEVRPFEGLEVEVDDEVSRLSDGEYSGAFDRLSNSSVLELCSSCSF